MKIYGYSSVEKHELIDPEELAEITLVATPAELRQIAKFIEQAAEGMEANSQIWEHEHLSDSFTEFKNSPHFVVWNPAQS